MSLQDRRYILGKCRRRVTRLLRMQVGRKTPHEA